MTLEDYLNQIGESTALKKENFEDEISQLIALATTLDIDLIGAARIMTKELVAEQYKLLTTSIKDNYFVEMQVMDQGRQRHLYFAKIDKGEFYGILDTLKEEIEFEDIEYSREVSFYGNNINVC